MGESVTVILLKGACLDLLIHGLMCVVSVTAHHERYVGITASCTVLLIAYQSYVDSECTHLRQNVTTTLVSLWALRLGLYLFIRITKERDDRRFNLIRHNVKAFIIYYIIQAAWIFVALLPLLINNSSIVQHDIYINDLVGWTMWGVGFLLEVIADYQKSAFRNDERNQGKFINVGLWRFSRHPNYLGEILMWFGIYLSTQTSFHGTARLAVMSPIFVTALITKLMGIPPLEYHAQIRWGVEPEYRRYIAKTKLLIPYVW